MQEDEIIRILHYNGTYCTYFISVFISQITMSFLSLTMSSKFLPVAFVCKTATKLKSKQTFVKNVRIFRQFVHEFFFSVLNIQFPLFENVQFLFKPIPTLFSIRVILNILILNQEFVELKFFVVLCQIKPQKISSLQLQ